MKTRPLIIASCLALSCDSGPTAPQGATGALSTSWGQVAVYTQGHDVNLDALASHLERGYARIAAQGFPPVSTSRLAVAMEDGVPANPPPGTVVGWYEDGVLHLPAGWERSAAHELQHWYACGVLRHRGNCCTLQDHPGGYDLSCNPR